MTAISTLNLPLSDALEEILGNATVAGQRTSARMTLTALATAILSSGSIADQIDDLLARIGEVEVDVADLSSRLGSLGTLSPIGAAAALLSAIGLNEARSAIGIEPNRVTLTGLSDYVVAVADRDPVVHYWYNNTVGAILRVDVSNLAAYASYTFVNDGAAGSIIRLEAGAAVQFRGTGRSPTATAARSIEVGAGEWVRLLRVGGDRIFVERASNSGHWMVTSNASYRMTADGLYEVVYVRPATSSIGAGLESTANSLPTWMDCSTATVLSVSYGTVAGGTAAPNYPCQVTKLGTTHGLATNNIFAILNPNAGAVSHPVIVHMIGVKGV